MSLFRSLQNSPATVSIFHNARIPLSNKLYNNLEKTYDTLPEKPKYEFTIDLMKDKMPTYDQYRLFVDKCLTNEQAKVTLQNCFPFLNDRQTHLYDTHGKTVTIKGIDWSNKIFSQSEYQMIYDTFNKLQEGNASIETTASDVFKAPLIVDWDQNKLAGDEKTLELLLKVYKDQ
ncbi:unnamed protein product [Candida verbasci]|uniref:Uncharacterized protein n=1 Tax=Candida verbasci TaxID=1227364 RepID=A0A9W4XFH4_9ASCO|nr:unnamed protein product [Candida verbasci]